MSLSLGEMVSELEDDYESLKSECRSLEENLNELEQDLEDITNQRNKLQEFFDWVCNAYPEVAKDFDCVKIIEEVANEHS